MSRASIGIDPGRDGAIVAIVMDPSGREVIALRARVDYLPGREKVAPLDLVAGYVRGVRTILDMVRDGRPGISIGVVTEVASIRPGEGGSSSLRTGMGAGAIYAALLCHGIPHEVLTPQAWRKRAGISVPQGGDPKAATVAHVERVLPALDLTPGAIRVPHVGLADAAGMALAGLVGR